MRLPIAPEGRVFVAVPLVLAILVLATAGAAGGEANANGGAINETRRASCATV